MEWRSPLICNPTFDHGLLGRSQGLYQVTSYCNATGKLPNHAPHGYVRCKKCRNKVKTEQRVSIKEMDTALLMRDLASIRIEPEPLTSKTPHALPAWAKWLIALASASIPVIALADINDPVNPSVFKLFMLFALAFSFALGTVVTSISLNSK